MAVADTVAFSESVRNWVALPFSNIGVVDGNAQSSSPFQFNAQRPPASTATGYTGVSGQIRSA
ncbi:MAG: hypothetical protein ORN29_07485 [Rhodoferax sp.]|nr:hypothetical protein [Rhodoferax sp.]